MTSETHIAGLAAEFKTPDELLYAAKHAYSEGYRKIDAFSPYHVDGLSEALGQSRKGVAAITLLGGILGGTLGYAMLYYSAVMDYPINVGGRPLHSWPAFVPVTFELTILFAALGAAIGMLALNRLPQLHHPAFEIPNFAERSDHRFYLYIESSDPLFSLRTTSAFLRRQNPAHVWPVSL